MQITYPNGAKKSTKFEKSKNLGTSFPFNEITDSLPDFPKKFVEKKEFPVASATFESQQSKLSTESIFDIEKSQKVNTKKLRSCKTEVVFSGQVSTFLETFWKCL